MTYKRILGLLIVALCSCSNSLELETSEMKVFTNIQKAIKDVKKYLDYHPDDNAANKLLNTLTSI